MGKRDDGESRESRLADGWIVEGETAETAGPTVSVEPAILPAGVDLNDEIKSAGASGAASTQGQQLSNGALVLLGVIGGVYLLYTWVWISWANTYSTLNSAVADGSGLLGSVMQQIVFWLAPFAPALWFFAVLVLNRGARLGKLVLWLLIGAVLLVPLPMFDFGAVA